MPKISITLPNVTEISMEADNPSELHQIVAMVKSDLLHELVRLPQPGAQGQDVPDAKNEEVPGPPDKNISVPSNGSSQTLDTKPLSSGKDQNGVAAPETASKGSPEEPQGSPLPSDRSTTRRDTPIHPPRPLQILNPGLRSPGPRPTPPSRRNCRTQDWDTISRFSAERSTRSVICERWWSPRKARPVISP